MDGLKDGLAYLVELGRDQRVTVQKAPDYKRTGRYFTIEGDDGVVERFAEPQPQDLLLSNLESFVAAVKARSAGVDRVFYSEEQVVCVAYEDGEDVNSVPCLIECRLDPSEEYLRLNDFVLTKALSQKHLVNALRYKVPEALPPAVVETFAKLKVTRRDGAATSVGRGLEAVDRSLAVEVQAGSGALPDAVTFSVARFAVPELRGVRHDLVCQVEVTEDALFCFWPEPDGLRRVTEAALDGVHKYLEQHLPSGMVLLRGHPGETNFHHFPL